jgi:hypothetical protein
MNIESGNSQETPESVEDNPLEFVVLTGHCPACSNGWITTWYREGEIGFTDTCDSCDFEGINITEWFDPAPYYGHSNLFG